MDVECELPLLDIKEIVIPSVFNTNHKIEIKNVKQNENKTDDEIEIESIEESKRTWVVNITALHGIFLRRIFNQNITIDKKLKFQIEFKCCYGNFFQLNIRTKNHFFN